MVEDFEELLGGIQTDVSIDQYTGIVKLDCPDCGSNLRFRVTQYGCFYGCPEYPECGFSLRAASDGSPVGELISSETRRLRKVAHHMVGLLGESEVLEEGELETWVEDNFNSGIDNLGEDDCSELIYMAQDMLDVEGDYDEEY